MQVDQDVPMVVTPAPSSPESIAVPADLDRLLSHYDSVGLPQSLADLGLADLDFQCILAHMAQDKKVKNGRLTFILARGIGEAFITQDVSEDEVLAVLAARRGSAPLAGRRVEA